MDAGSLRRQAPTTSGAANDMVQAHQMEAEAIGYVESQQRRIEDAVDQGAREVEFVQASRDDREAVFTVFCHSTLDDVSVVAVQLQQVDDRPPQPRERMALECHLVECLEAGGAVWLEFLSYVGR